MAAKGLVNNAAVEAAGANGITDAAAGVDNDVNVAKFAAAAFAPAALAANVGA